jgi:murein DD-endopeptidase MepM/ murein hydrolase activator NlpD
MKKAGFSGGFLAGVFIAVLVFGRQAFAQENNTKPLIKKLASTDAVFRQFRLDVDAGSVLVHGTGRRAQKQGRMGGAEIAEKLVIYGYETQPGDDFFRVAGESGLSMGTIITLNRLNGPQALKNVPTLQLSCIQGIFLPEEPEGELERLVYSLRRDKLDSALTVEAEGVTFRFLPGDTLTQTEWTFFLFPGVWSFPLKEVRLTSRFGSRISPINGKSETHAGLDFGAAEGTEVYAARDGAISLVSENSVYGRHIVITHDDGWTSLYGHLSEVLETAGNKVKSGDLIGKTGATGLVSGPHLHFELRQNGQARNPEPLLKH